MAITATEARKRLFPLIKQVNEDRAPVEIISNHGRAYLVAADDYESMEETDYLLRSPANAARLTTAADQVRRGRSLLTKTMDELRAEAGSPRYSVESLSISSSRKTGLCTPAVFIDWIIRPGSAPT
jgi:antitoxin YefM